MSGARSRLHLSLVSFIIETFPLHAAAHTAMHILVKGTTYWIPHRVRNEVAKRSAGICFNCGKKAARAEVNKRGVLVFFDEGGRIFHLDHNKTPAAAGDHTEENLVLSCADCNLSKRRRRTANDPTVRALMDRINKGG